jgi:hypothetical protein
MRKLPILIALLVIFIAIPSVLAVSTTRTVTITATSPTFSDCGEGHSWLYQAQPYTADQSGSYSFQFDNVNSASDPFVLVYPADAFDPACYHDNVLGYTVKIPTEIALEAGTDYLVISGVIGGEGEMGMFDLLITPPVEG